MVTVEAFEPAAWNDSAPGAPWGGQSTIWDACRDLMLAERGRYLQPTHLKPRRHVYDLATRSSLAREEPRRPGEPKARSATLRRMPQWPAPTFDSSAFKMLQLQLPPDPIPPQPSAHGRLDGDGEVRDMQRAPVEDPQEPGLPLELKWPGVRPVVWSTRPGVGDPGGEKPLAREVATASRANSASPRFSPFRFGASIVRQQRGTAGSYYDASRPHTAEPTESSSRGQQNSNSLQSYSSSQLRPQTAKASGSRKSSKSVGSSGGQRSLDSRVYVEPPPIELIPPYVPISSGA